MIKDIRLLAPLPFALLAACTTQPAYQPPAIGAPAAWSAVSGPSEPVSRDGWWTLLRDPAIDRLVASGLDDNPTLAEAAARVDRARALLAVEDARKLPAVGLEGSASWSRDRASGGNGTDSQLAATLGARLSWEIDLWGRVRENALAARSRLAARAADAEAARLAVIGEIADTVLALRACHLTLDIRDRDIASRETELKIGRARLAFGNIAPVEVAAAESNLGAARTDRALQYESCQRLVNALTALSGRDRPSVAALLSDNAVRFDSGIDAPIPVVVPPAFSPALPATVLLEHPAVVAAEREAAARWSEIAVARAERLPRLDLAALLTGQWIRALGSSASFVSNSASAGATMPLFDGGAGAANVRAAEAAYREAAARLDIAVRAAVRDVEDGLAARRSAETRFETAAAALDAAAFTLRANEARWRAGAIAQFELEEARRQYNRAQESMIVAATDRARSWVALVRRTGPAASANPAGPDAGPPAGPADFANGNDS